MDHNSTHIGTKACLNVLPSALVYEVVDICGHRCELMWTDTGGLEHFYRHDIGCLLVPTEEQLLNDKEG